MNDWLDYKGSGSARAYAADGLMGDSNMSHGLFSKSKAKSMQSDAVSRLYDAYME